MTIKSDKWIRKMAEEHGMIEPFEPKLIREKDNQKNCVLWRIQLWV